MQLSERIIRPDTGVNPLVERLHEKQQLLEAGDPANEQIRTALVLNGGAMFAVNAAGVAKGLELLGMREVFDNVVGVSGGAGVGAYFLAGQAEEGVDIFASNLATRDYTNPFRLKSIVSVEYLERVLTELRPIDRDQLSASRSRLHVGVTDVSMYRAKGTYVQLGNEGSPDVVEALKATSTVPGFTPPIKIGKKKYVDGGISCKNPIDYAITQLGATDILVVNNEPKSKGQTVPFWERAFFNYAMGKYSRDARQALFDRFVGSDQSLVTSYPAGINIGLLLPESMPIRSLSHRTDLVHEVGDRAVTQTMRIFGVTQSRSMGSMS